MRRSDLCEEVRQALRRLPPPFESHYGVVPSLPVMSPSVMPVAARHQDAITSLARLETLTSELRDPWLVSRLLVRREAVSSSAIEGTNSTLDELLAAEEGDEASAVNDEQRGALRQVRDYALCLDALVPEAKRQGVSVFSASLIRELHCAVMKGETTYLDTPGEIRRKVVWIGGRGNIAYSTYNPTPPDDVPRCLSESVAYIRGDDAIGALHTSLVTRMAVAHAHFEAVHPFRDGNGRVGRLMLPLMMAADGHAPLYLSPYIEANQTGYYAALKAAQQRHQWHEMIGYMADAIIGTVEELLATRRALADLERDWLTRRRFRAGSAAAGALKVLPHYPVVTVRRLAGMLNVSWPQASHAIDQLASVGILTEKTGYRRNRMFTTREALSIVNRPFGEEAVLPQSQSEMEDNDGSRGLSGGPGQ